MGRKKGCTHPGDIAYDAVDDLTLEGLKHNSTIACDELGLAVTRDDHTLTDVRDGDDGDDEAGVGVLNVRIELRLEVACMPEVGRM